MSLYRRFICKILNEHEPSPFIKIEYPDGIVTHVCTHCRAEIQEDACGKWKRIKRSK